MAYSLAMPALGESVTEGTVTRWLKQEGETVEVDEPLVEVSTDKVDTEIPSPAAGVLERIVVPEDETVAVGAELAVIDDASAPITPPRSAPRHAAPGPTEVGDGRSAQPPQQPAVRSAPSPQGSRKLVTMPALGESVTEGTVTRWLKQVGDTVEVDEPLVEVSTDKVDTEIPSPAAGVLERIMVPEDETVQVGAELAVIGDASRPSPPPPSMPRHAAPSPTAPPPVHASSDRPAQLPQQPAVSPAASGAGSRKLVTMPALGESVTEG
ncbi:MAG: pyruvate dehydrogenase complex dihydrolipoyllysine-residue acetyltransferase, partial [Actinomycetota bacterium]|nr:pyruvate dehydrogenase complex dihydrolipoyllysine-residue acetyltransferase [Actinomycetota bacterium]